MLLSLKRLFSNKRTADEKSPRPMNGRPASNLTNGGSLDSGYDNSSLVDFSTTSMRSNKHKFFRKGSNASRSSSRSESMSPIRPVVAKTNGEVSCSQNGVDQPVMRTWVWPSTGKSAARPMSMPGEVTSSPLSPGGIVPPQSAGLLPSSGSSIDIHAYKIDGSTGVGDDSESQRSRTAAVVAAAETSGTSSGTLPSEAEAARDEFELDAELQPPSMSLVDEWHQGLCRLQRDNDSRVADQSGCQSTVDVAQNRSSATRTDFETTPSAAGLQAFDDRNVEFRVPTSTSSSSSDGGIASTPVPPPRKSRSSLRSDSDLSSISQSQSAFRSATLVGIDGSNFSSLSAKSTRQLLPTSSLEDETVEGVLTGSADELEDGDVGQPGGSIGVFSDGSDSSSAGSAAADATSSGYSSTENNRKFDVNRNRKCDADGCIDSGASSPATTVNSLRNLMRKVDAASPRGGSTVAAPVVLMTPLKFSSNCYDDDRPRSGSLGRSADCCGTGKPLPPQLSQSNGYVSPFIGTKSRSFLTLDGLRSTPAPKATSSAEVGSGRGLVVRHEKQISDPILSDVCNSANVEMTRADSSSCELASFTEAHELTVCHCLNDKTSQTMLRLAANCSCEEIIRDVLKRENISDDWRLFQLVDKSLSPSPPGENDLQYSDRPLLDGYGDYKTKQFELNRKKGARIKIVCDTVVGRPKQISLDIAPNETTCDVIKMAIERYELTNEDAGDFSLIQMDRITKDLKRVKEDTFVADLRKEFFLLCKKENLARRKSTVGSSSMTPSPGISHSDLTSPCSVSCLLSPSSPGPYSSSPASQLRVPSASNLSQQSDRCSSPSAFLFNTSTASDFADTSALQSRVNSLEREMAAKERAWNDRLSLLQKSLDRFKACALSSDPSTTMPLLELEFNDATRQMQLHEQRVRQAQTHIDKYRESPTTGAFTEKIAELESRLHEAEKQLSTATLEQQKLFPILEEVRKAEQLSRTDPRIPNKVNVTSSESVALYDVVTKCRSRCYAFASLLRPGECSRLRASRDVTGWLRVDAVAESCVLLPGDRFIELDSTPVSHLDDKSFQSVLTSSEEKPLRVVVLRESSEEPTLLQDICQWMEKMN